MPVHILVVDDEPELEAIIRQKFRRRIRAGAWTFSFAREGYEALEKLEAYPDTAVVLTDLKMPRMDGLTLLKALGERDFGGKAVVVSAYHDLQNIRQAMNEGAFDFLTKPINLSDLEATVVKTVAEIERHREAKAVRAKLATVEKELSITKELEALKSRFFANISHEFRTPLTLILGPLHDALQDVFHTGGTLPADYVRLTHRHAQRLLELINQLLDLAKLESGRMRLRAYEQDLVPFVRERVAAFTSQADRQTLHLQFQTYTPSCPLYFDAEYVERILTNLLSNALKFTPPHGKVAVSLRPVGDNAVALIVRDTGMGIAEDQRALIFDRFAQAQSGETQVGTGIGLALTKALVERHGGTITVDSELGFGSTFTVAFPLDPSYLSPDDRVRADETAHSPHTHENDPLDPDDFVPTSASPPKDAPTVLVVEDHSDVRSYVRHHLASFYHIEEAKDGEAGLKRATSLKPALILSDVRMPGMDGYTLCRRLKQDEALRSIPVILLTALADDEDRLQGLDAGADAFLLKPFNAQELRLRVENLIEVRRVLRKEGPIAIQATAVHAPSADAVFLEQVQAEIEARLHDPTFEITSVADAIGLSPRQMRRRIRALTRLSPSGLVRTLRLQRAAQLLAQQTGTIAEVAYAVGFQDARHFSRVFKHVYGTTPSNYRAPADA